MSWLYHAKVTVIPMVKYAIKTFRAQRWVERHKDIKIPRCSNKTCIASNFLDTVIILHTTAYKISGFFGSATWQLCIT